MIVRILYLILVGSLSARAEGPKCYTYPSYSYFKDVKIELSRNADSSINLKLFRGAEILIHQTAQLTAKVYNTQSRVQCQLVAEQLDAVDPTLKHQVLISITGIDRDSCLAYDLDLTWKYEAVELLVADRQTDDVLESNITHPHGMRCP